MYGSNATLLDAQPGVVISRMEKKPFAFQHHHYLLLLLLLQLLGQKPHKSQAKPEGVCSPREQEDVESELSLMLR